MMTRDIFVSFILLFCVSLFVPFPGMIIFFGTGTIYLWFDIATYIDKSVEVPAIFSRHCMFVGNAISCLYQLSFVCLICLIVCSTPYFLLFTLVGRTILFCSGLVYILDTRTNCEVSSSTSSIKLSAGNNLSCRSYSPGTAYYTPPGGGVYIGMQFRTKYGMIRMQRKTPYRQILDSNKAKALTQVHSLQLENRYLKKIIESLTSPNLKGSEESVKVKAQSPESDIQRQHEMLKENATVVKTIQIDKVKDLTQTQSIQLENERSLEDLTWYNLMIRHEKQNTILHGRYDDVSCASRTSLHQRSRSLLEFEDWKQESGHKLRKQYDDTMSEIYVHQYSKIIVSVGCLRSQYGIGTIFRAGSKYGMTAAHVVTAIINPHMQEKGDLNLLRHDHVYVLFSETRADIKFRLSGKIVYLNTTIDVAIVEFSDECIHMLPPPLSLLSYDIFESQNNVSLIGFGHKTNDCKCVEHYVEVLDLNSIHASDINAFIETNYFMLKSALIRHGKDANSVENGYKGYDEPHNVLLNAFVGPGASGSPIFTKANPSSLQVVALFTSGFPKFSYELPSTVSYPMKYTFEAGTKMTYIYKDLARRDKELAEELFGGNTNTEEAMVLP